MYVLNYARIQEFSSLVGEGLGGGGGAKLSRQKTTLKTFFFYLFLFY